ncbi:hypothetical protein G7Y89_g12451 [Cudoniella acicularis]|uniref:Uncharacterized protein n=1 Tax=Cudoniella acicularis TaxID=354080 RepID=A0A8H4RB66_9HELO|nr:hypothetical protein G7Y89_g12451 [Cudoniella acicularis]
MSGSPYALTILFSLNITFTSYGTYAIDTSSKTRLSNLVRRLEGYLTSVRVFNIYTGLVRESTVRSTALFTPIVNGEVLYPLTEDNRTASLLDKVEMTLLESILSSPSSTGQQQASLYNTAPTQAQQVDGEQPLPTQDSQTILSPSPPGEAPILADIVAKAVHIIYEMSRHNPSRDPVRSIYTADPQKIELLSILNEQVELLVKEGRPDLSRFFDSLESHSITASEEVSSLRAEYGLKREPEEFKDLGFGYTKADDEVDLDRVIKELVGDCQTFLKDNAL